MAGKIVLCCPCATLCYLILVLQIKVGSRINRCIEDFNTAL